MLAFTALLLAAAAPVAAQMPPPPPGAMPGMPGMRHGNPMFAGLSEAGQATMRNAMGGNDRRANRAATAAARDRMLTVLDAERLDAGALKRAMDDERTAANDAKARHQAAMIAGFQQLSVADRHAFVASARTVRARMENMAARWQMRRGAGRPAGMGGGEMPPRPR